MTTNLRDKAKELAAQNYTMLVFRDETTEDEPIYVATNPELNGCVAQGDTPDEAQHNLDEIRVDIIHHMLEHGLAVPYPKPLLNPVFHINSDYETETGNENFEVQVSQFTFKGVTAIIKT